MIRDTDRELWDDTHDLLKLIDKKILACRFAQHDLRIFIQHLKNHHGDKITEENLSEMGRGLTRIAFLADCINNDVAEILKKEKSDD